MKVCMFVYNNFKHDARVLKEARALVETGYDVKVIALLDNMSEPYEERDGFRIIRVKKDPIHYKGRRRLRKFLLINLAGFNVELIRKRMLVSFRSLLKVMSGRLVKAENSRTIIRSTLSLFRRLISTLGGIFRKTGRTIKESWARTFVRDSSKSSRRESADGGRPVALSYRVYDNLMEGIYCAIRWPATQLKSICGQWLRTLLTVLHRPLCFIDYYCRSFKLVRQEPADIYHAHDLNTLLVAYWARKKTGGKLLYDSHELYTETSALSKVERFLSTILEKCLIRRCDVVVTVNISIAQELSKRYKLTRPNVIMNCTPTSKRQYWPDNGLLRQKLGLDGEIPIVLYQGGYSPNRGLENLILSAHYLKQGTVVLMGWGKLEQELRALAVKQCLHDKILFVDPAPQEELLGYTVSATVGVIPYQFIGLNNYYCTPNKLFEFIVTGVPIVGSNFPELKKVIEGYNLGKTFNPDDPEDIAEAINYVLSDKQRYLQMKKNALRAARVFNWENESKKLLKIYKKLEDELNIKSN